MYGGYDIIENSEAISFRQIISKEENYMEMRVKKRTFKFKRCIAFVMAFFVAFSTAFAGVPAVVVRANGNANPAWSDDPGNTAVATWTEDSTYKSYKIRVSIYLIDNEVNELDYFEVESNKSGVDVSTKLQEIGREINYGGVGDYAVGYSKYSARWEVGKVPPLGMLEQVNGFDISFELFGSTGNDDNYVKIGTSNVKRFQISEKENYMTPGVPVIKYNEDGDGKAYAIIDKMDNLPEGAERVLFTGVCDKKFEDVETYGSGMMGWERLLQTVYTDDAEIVDGNKYKVDITDSFLGWDNQFTYFPEGEYEIYLRQIITIPDTNASYINSKMSARSNTVVYNFKPSTKEKYICPDVKIDNDLNVTWTPDSRADISQYYMDIGIFDEKDQIFAKAPICMNYYSEGSPERKEWESIDLTATSCSINIAKHIRRALSSINVEEQNIKVWVYLACEGNDEFDRSEFTSATTEGFFRYTPLYEFSDGPRNMTIKKIDGGYTLSWEQKQLEWCENLSVSFECNNRDYKCFGNDNMLSFDEVFSGSENIVNEMVDGTPINKKTPDGYYVFTRNITDDELKHEYDKAGFKGETVVPVFRHYYMTSYQGREGLSRPCECRIESGYNTNEYTAVEDYKVSPVEHAFVRKGGTKNLGIVSVQPKGASHGKEVWNSSNTDKVVIKADGEITGKEVGDSVVSCMINGISNKSTTVHVYDVVTNAGEENEETVKETAGDLIDSIGNSDESILEGEEEVISGTDIDKDDFAEVQETIIEGVANGDDVCTDLVETERDEDYYAEHVDDYEAFQAWLEGDGSGYKVGFGKDYVVEMYLKSKEGETKHIGDIVDFGEGNELTLEFSAPSGFASVASGFGRRYKVVRMHNGQPQEMEYVFENGKFKLKSSLFSDFIVVYEDYPINPTDDGTITDAVWSDNTEKTAICNWTENTKYKQYKLLVQMYKQSEDEKPFYTYELSSGKSGVDVSAKIKEIGDKINDGTYGEGKFLADEQIENLFISFCVIGSEDGESFGTFNTSYSSAKKKFEITSKRHYKTPDAPVVSYINGDLKALIPDAVMYNNDEYAYNLAVMAKIHLSDADVREVLLGSVFLSSSEKLASDPEKYEISIGKSVDESLRKLGLSYGTYNISFYSRVIVDANSKDYINSDASVETELTEYQYRKLSKYNNPQVKIDKDLNVSLLVDPRAKRECYRIWYSVLDSNGTELVNGAIGSNAFSEDAENEDKLMWESMDLTGESCQYSIERIVRRHLSVKDVSAKKVTVYVTGIIFAADDEHGVMEDSEYSEAGVEYDYEPMYEYDSIKDLSLSKNESGYEVSWKGKKEYAESTTSKIWISYVYNGKEYAVNDFWGVHFENKPVVSDIDGDDDNCKWTMSFSENELNNDYERAGFDGEIVEPVIHVKLVGNNDEGASPTASVSADLNYNGIDKIAVSDYTVSPQDALIRKGNKYRLSIVDVAPKNASHKIEEWRSDNTACVMVDETGEITGSELGNANIYCAINSMNEKKTTVHVYEMNEEVAGVTDPEQAKEVTDTAGDIIDSIGNDENPNLEIVDGIDEENLAEVKEELVQAIDDGEIIGTDLEVEKQAAENYEETYREAWLQSDGYKLNGWDFWTWFWWWMFGSDVSEHDYKLNCGYDSTVQMYHQPKDGGDKKEFGKIKEFEKPVGFSFESENYDPEKKYKVIRIHDGEPQTLTEDEWSVEDGTFDVRSKLFSDFIVVEELDSPEIDLKDAVVTVEGSYTYSKKVHTPAVTVVLDKKELISDTDYTIEYKNNVNAGTATVIVTGVGKYTGTAKGTFTIAKKGLTTSGLKFKNKYYDGSKYMELVSQTPTVTGVIDGDEVVVKTKLPKYVIKGTKSPGNKSRKLTVGMFTISGKDAANYRIAAGTTASGTIKKVSVSKVTLKNTTVAYNGKSQKPVIASILGNNKSKILQKNCEIKYTRDGKETRDFKSKGTIIVIVTGQTNWKGSKSVKYTIK